MIDSERFKLLYGPYVPPKCRVGDTLPCAYRGREVKVRCMTDAAVQWPATRRGLKASPIVCGDLIRAVRVESEIAVAYHWGVGANTVWTWRRALEVPRMTSGTRRLVIDNAAETLTPEVRAMADEAKHSPGFRAKRRAMMTGRPVHPKTAAGLLEAARRPKSEQWKRALSQRMRKLWEEPEEHGLPPCHHWTEQEIAMIGTGTDAAIARALGLPRYAVIHKRYQLGIPSFVRAADQWTEDEIALLGTATDPEIARRVAKSAGAVAKKRKQLGIRSFVPGWTEHEIALLGTHMDRVVADVLGRSRKSVTSQRQYRGIPAYHKKERDSL